MKAVRCCFALLLTLTCLSLRADRAQALFRAGLSHSDLLAVMEDIHAYQTGPRRALPWRTWGNDPPGAEPRQILGFLFIFLGGFLAFGLI